MYISPSDYSRGSRIPLCTGSRTGPSKAKHSSVVGGARSQTQKIGASPKGARIINPSSDRNAQTWVNEVYNSSTYSLQLTISCPEKANRQNKRAEASVSRKRGPWVSGLYIAILNFFWKSYGVVFVLLL